MTLHDTVRDADAALGRLAQLEGRLTDVALALQSAKFLLLVMDEGAGAFHSAEDLLEGTARVIANLREEVRSSYQQQLVQARAELGCPHFEPDVFTDWTVEEAVQLFLRAGESARPQASGQHNQDTMRAFIETGQVLANECRRLSTTEAMVRAREAAMKKGGPAGAPLIDGKDSGGRRHYLSGRPVSAGTSLYLLTRFGWLPVRYETTVNNDPVLHIRIFPDNDLELSVHVDNAATFAWPTELDAG